MLLEHFWIMGFSVCVCVLTSDVRCIRRFAYRLHDEVNKTLSSSNVECVFRFPIKKTDENNGSVKQRLRDHRCWNRWRTLRYSNQIVFRRSFFSNRQNSEEFNRFSQKIFTKLVYRL